MKIVTNENLRKHGIAVKLIYKDGGWETIRLSTSNEFVQLCGKLGDTWTGSTYYLEGRSFYLPGDLSKLPSGSFVVIKEDQ